MGNEVSRADCPESKRDGYVIPPTKLKNDAYDHASKRNLAIKKERDLVPGSSRRSKRCP
jgi:hypothetical protein